jgi:hypothetical protein
VGGTALLLSLALGSSARHTLPEQLAPFPWCPAQPLPIPHFTRQLPFLKNQVCAEKWKLFSHCWAGGVWHSERMSQERISN